MARPLKSAAGRIENTALLRSQLVNPFAGKAGADVELCALRAGHRAAIFLYCTPETPRLAGRT